MLCKRILIEDKMLCKRIVIEGHTSYPIQGVNLREEVEKFVRGTINSDKIRVKGKISNLKNGPKKWTSGNNLLWF